MKKPTRIERAAHHVVVRKTSHGIGKSDIHTSAERPIHSINTESHYKYSMGSYFRWRKQMGLSIGKPYFLSESIEFLREMAETLEQKQLDSCRQALQKTLDQQLPKLTSQKETRLTTRAYDPKEVQQIIHHQSDANALASVLCYKAGLRDHELLTLRRANELPRSTHREWSPDLFREIESPIIYTVTGKGGLRRHVAIPHDLATLLEQRRLPEPAIVRDRGIDYVIHYAIGGGQALSQSFCDASNKALGYSNGSHGLRHSFAQQRLLSLRQAGLEVNQALTILSQELGHFRIAVTWAYLR